MAHRATAAAVVKQIQRILRRDHEPMVKIGPSSIAGRGVFVAASHAATGEILCLYPGIYTPPLPAYASPESHYLANQTAPSGGLLVENAYILNLQTVGGYIDGNVNLSTVSNASGCGQLVNHSASEPNVEVVSFRYSSILNVHGVNHSEEFAIPNCLRDDGSPWYLDADLGEVITLNELTPRVMLCGAALCASRDMAEKDELLLDYGLSDPLPLWAVDWYR